MSANTGFAPKRQTALAVAKNVKLGTITSSPGPMPRASSTSSKASLPDAQPTACSVPQYSAMAASNLAQAGPCTNVPLRETSAIAASSSDWSRLFSRVTSSIGTEATGALAEVLCIELVLGREIEEGRKLDRSSAPVNLKAAVVLAVAWQSPNNRCSHHAAAGVLPARRAAASTQRQGRNHGFTLRQSSIGDRRQPRHRRCDREAAGKRRGRCCDH